MGQFTGDLRDFLETGDDLPTLPGVVLELHAALENEHATNHQITGIIERDPALASRLVRLANSAAFCRGSDAADVDHALRLLGLKQVRWLCLAVAVVNTLSTRRGGLGHRTFWCHSAAVALIARRLGSCFRFRHVSTEILYLGGLLHDIGLLVLDQFFPDAMRHCVVTASKTEVPLAHVEAEELGMTHGEIGGLLLGRWGLPPLLAEMVSGHHHPTESPVQYRDACWLVYAAELISQGSGAALPLEGLTERHSQRIVSAIRAAEFDIDVVVDDLNGQATEFASALV